MIKAKDCVGPLSPWMVTCLGLSLCFLELGCSGMGGLRSIGIDPAILPGFPGPLRTGVAGARE